MTAVREELVEAVDKLRLAFLDLKTIDADVTALTAGVGDLTLSESVRRVSQAARAAAALASRVLKATEVAQAAGGKATTMVTAAREAKAAAEQAAAAVAEAAAVAAKTAEEAAVAAAALEAKIHPPVPVDYTRWQSGTDGINNGQGGACSSGGAMTGYDHANVTSKATESDMSVDEEEEEGEGYWEDEEDVESEGDSGTLSSCEGSSSAGGGTEQGSHEQEAGEITPGGFQGREQLKEMAQEDDVDRGESDEEASDTPKEEEEREGQEEEEEEKDEEGEGQGEEDEQARKRERTLPYTGKSCGRNVRAARGRNPSYVESPIREPSKRPRKASARVTGARSSSDGAASPPSTKSTSAVAQRQGDGSTACGHAECTARAAYGTVASKTKEFCFKHAKQGMVNIKNKSCSHPGCTTRPNFGLIGTKKAEYCSKHAREGMANVGHKTCGHLGCTTLPSFGMAGSKKEEFCVKHAKSGMINVKNRRCDHLGCPTRANFGMVGSKKAEFCSKHAKAGMKNVRNIK